MAVQGSGKMNETNRISMKRTEQIANDVRTLYREIGKEFELTNMDSYLSNIYGFIESNLFIIDVLVLSSLSTHSAEKLSNFLFGNVLYEFENTINTKSPKEITIKNDGQNILYRICFSDKVSLKKTEDQPAFISICVYNPDLLDEDTLPLICNRYLENIPLIISLSTENDVKKLPLQIAYIKLIESTLNEHLTNETFNSFLNGLLANNNSEIFKESSIIEYIAYINKILKHSIEQEEENINSKKFIFQQQISLLQQTTNNTTTEWLQGLKAQVGKYFTDYEKGVKTKIEDITRPQTGLLWNEFEDRVNSLDKLDKIDKAKMTEVRISKEFEVDFLGTIYKRLYSYFSNDLKSLSDLYKEISSNVETELKQIGITLLPYYFNHLTDKAITKILDSSVRIDRPYKNETPRKGAYEYFMAVRRYQIVFIMLFSTFGVALASFKQYMIPVTIVLLAIGGYFVWKSVTEEREDTAAKELERAKESLRTEYKRILSESQREWMTTLSDHQKEQVTHLVNSLEKQTKDFSAKKATLQSEQKKLVSRQAQGVDLKQKVIQESIKRLASINNSILQHKSELKTSLSNILNRLSI